MIIDFHTHTFPDNIAEKALKKLSDSSRAVPYTKGTASSRFEFMKEAGIEMILFGTDSPWSSQKEYVDKINSLDFTDKEREMIFSENAKELLK